MSCVCHLLDERVAGPAVDAEVGVAIGLEGAAVFDGPGGVGVSWRDRLIVVIIWKCSHTWPNQGSSPFRRRSFRRCSS
jgi:hypothetical protein